MICPFCKRGPYHYVDVGVAMAPVAINCCDAMVGLYRGEKKAKQAIRFMQSHSPKRKARAKRILEDYYDQ